MPIPIPIGLFINYYKRFINISSFIPHKSDKYTTDNSRSIFYFTHNKLEEGPHYQHYIARKIQYVP